MSTNETNEHDWPSGSGRFWIVRAGGLRGGAQRGPSGAVL